MISLRLALGRLEDRRLPNRVCPHETPDILGTDLNCSESRLFTPACGAPKPTSAARGLPAGRPSETGIPCLSSRVIAVSQRLD